MPPRTPEEARLVEIWKNVLRLEAVGVDDDFFELGGHSLLATQVVSRIRDAFHVDLPLVTLFTSPTVATLCAQLLAQSEVADAPAGRTAPAQPVTPPGAGPISDAHPRLLKVHETGTRRPFFFLYPEVTTAFYGLDLARRLGTDQPFYIVHPHGFDGGPIPLTIEEMAAKTRRLMHAAQPQGPYLLGARCAAGTEAFEVALQLQAAGQRVDMLVLIDAEIPPYKSNWLPRVRRAGQRLRLSEFQQRQLYLSLSRPRQKCGSHLDQVTTFLNTVATAARRGHSAALAEAWAGIRERLQAGGRPARGCP